LPVVFIEALFRCFPDLCRVQLPSAPELAREYLRLRECSSLKNACAKCKEVSDAGVRSLMRRALLVAHARETDSRGLPFDYSTALDLACSSIFDLPEEAVAIPIGSQGFATIPLYKYDEGQAAYMPNADLSRFEFIRLHFWAPATSQSTDAPRLSPTHSHLFHARSWVLFGSIQDTRHIIKRIDDGAQALFRIEYNQSLDDSGKHSSRAINTGHAVRCESEESIVFSRGETYEVEAGAFHSSQSLGPHGLSVTLFRFSGARGLSMPSLAVGPKDIEETLVSRSQRGISARDVIIQVTQYSNER
jgi:hypothetical protein